MNSLGRLDTHLRKLHVLQHRSSKVLDQFNEHTETISTKAEKIKKEVKPFQVALENIQATIDEAEIATTFHSLPLSVREVLQRRNTDPIAIVDAITHLVGANEYIESHSDNTVAENLLVELNKNLETIVKVAEERVCQAVLEAVAPPGTGGGATSARGRRKSGVFSSPPNNKLLSQDPKFTWKVIHNPEALHDIDEIVHALSAVFDRRNVANEIKEILQDKINEIVGGCFTDSYREEYEFSSGGSGGDNTPFGKRSTSRGDGGASSTRNYKKGNHPLARFSAGARTLVAEAGSVMQDLIFSPLEDDFEVVSLAGDMGSAIADAVFSRAEAATYISSDVVHGSPTKVFIDSGGAGFGTAGSDGASNFSGGSALGAHGISMMGGNTRVRDSVFIGLDLLSELWQWQGTAKCVQGDNTTLVETIDVQIGRYIRNIRTTLDRYQQAKGSIDVDKLISHGMQSNARPAWFPSQDCAPHESSVSFIHFLKVLFSEYFGSLKLVLCDGIDRNVAAATQDPMSKATSLENIRAFVLDCVVGHVQDISTIGQAATKIQQDTAPETELDIISNFVDAAMNTELRSSTASASAAVLNAGLFTLNNVCFLQHHLGGDPCFGSYHLLSDDAIKNIMNPRNKSGRGGGDTDDDDDVGSNASSRDLNDLADDDDPALMKRSSSGFHGGSKVGELIVKASLDYLENGKAEAVEEYGNEWLTAFPFLTGEDADPEIDEMFRIFPRSEDLPKAMRMSVKLWHKKAVFGVLQLLMSANFHLVWDTSFKRALREAAAESVDMGFSAMENILGDRQWSTRPHRYVVVPINQLVQRARSIY